MNPFIASPGRCLHLLRYPAGSPTRCPLAPISRLCHFSPPHLLVELRLNPTLARLGAGQPLQPTGDVPIERVRQVQPVESQAQQDGKGTSEAQFNLKVLNSFGTVPKWACTTILIDHIFVWTRNWSQARVGGRTLQSICGVLAPPRPPLLPLPTPPENSRVFPVGRRWVERRRVNRPVDRPVVGRFPRQATMRHVNG